MPVTTRPLIPMLTLPELFDRFLEARSGALTPRAFRAYNELLDLLGDYLRVRKVVGIPCDPAFFVKERLAPGDVPGQRHREQRAAIDGFIELLDDFCERHLMGLLGADERDRARRGEAMVRELARWLRTTRLAPPAQTPRRSQVALVRDRARPRSAATGRAAQGGAITRAASSRSTGARPPLAS
jgi:hypothetical protein